MDPIGPSFQQRVTLSGLLDIHAAALRRPGKFLIRLLRHRGRGSAPCLPAVCLPACLPSVLPSCLPAYSSIPLSLVRVRQPAASPTSNNEDDRWCLWAAMQGHQRALYLGNHSTTCLCDECQDRVFSSFFFRKASRPLKSSRWREHPPQTKQPRSTEPGRSLHSSTWAAQAAISTSINRKSNAFCSSRNKTNAFWS